MHTRMTSKERAAFSGTTTNKTSKPYYQYPTLPQGSIRLLKIRPTRAVKESNTLPVKTESLEEQLEISLETFNLSHCPPFAALSYTWGLPGSFADPKQSVFTMVERVYPILCDDTILLGTWNLRSALRRIRHGLDICTCLDDGGKDGNQDARLTQILYADVSYIWIDAICIDQSNLPERSDQVSNMSKIYRQAHKTLVWLGEDDRFSKDAFGALSKLRNQLSKAHDQLRRTGTNVAIPGVNLEPSERKACAALFSRKWFTRSWIVQEVLLSKDLWVLIGQRFTSFDLFERARTLWQLTNTGLTGTTEQTEDVNPYPLYAQARENILTLTYMESSRKAVSEGKLLDFMSVMNMCRSQECSDPRDRLYSVLALCSEFYKDNKISFYPDYTKPVGKIYMQVASLVISARRDLALLNLVSSSRITPCLPSWCPDFVHLQATISNFAKQLQPWRFSNLFEDSVQITKNNMRVYGQRIGTVCEAVSLFRRPDEHLDPFQEWLRTGPGSVLSLLTRLEIRENPEALNMQNLSRVELLWRTIMGRMETCFSQLADWRDDHLPSGVALLLPQLLRTMLFFHLSFYFNRETQTEGLGKDIPHEILQAYDCKLDSALAQIIAFEPQNKEFLPLRKDLDSFCLRCSRNIDDAVSVVIDLSGDEQREWRKRARILSLDLPHSFTRPPKIQLTDETPFTDLRKTGTWHIAFSNGLLHLKDALVFRTETHLFGITRCLMQQDDEIWILDSAFAPVCLRPLLNGNYQFIGEVYMEGLMKGGEAISFCDSPVSITLE